jgi:hypothetical protein
MNPENYKTKRQGQPKRTSVLSKSKSSMLANAKATTPYASSKLREIYSTKAEWATKVMPKLKEQ